MVAGGPRAADQFTRREIRLLTRLNAPHRIQDYLDALAYSTEPIYRSPRGAMRDRKAHCADGALFAAAALRFHGDPPLVLQLGAENDDCHLLAVYRRGGAWGALAKSNFTGLRAREPVYRSLRELAISYFDQYFNILGQRTLRSYTRPLNLTAYDRIAWMTRDAELERIMEGLDRLRPIPLLSHAQIERLTRVDRITLRAGALYADPKGMYVPSRDIKP